MPRCRHDADISEPKFVGEVKAGDKVVITAGVSGVGTFQIQAAKILGAEVAASARNEAKSEFVRRPGPISSGPQTKCTRAASDRTGPCTSLESGG